MSWASKFREIDAKVTALRLLKQHSPETARRIAAETALSFPRGGRGRPNKGRLFWQEVAEQVNLITNDGEHREVS